MPTTNLPHTGLPLVGTHAQRLVRLADEAQAIVDDGGESEAQYDSAWQALTLLESCKALVDRDNYKRVLSAKLRKVALLLGVIE